MTSFFALYTIRDALEITICIYLYYLCNQFLYKEEHKNLLKLWYAYHLVMIVTYAADLSTLFFIAACCFPLVIMLGIIFHEERLQKMFIVAQRVDPLTVTTTSSSWIDELIKFALVRLNEQKDLSVVIEYFDELTPLIHAQESVHADLKKNTLELLYSSFMMPQESFLLITHKGKIIDLAARWKHVRRDETVRITTATDCIAFHSCAATRKCTITIGAKILEHLSADHARNILYELDLTAHQKEERHYVTQDNFPPYHDTTFS